MVRYGYSCCPNCSASFTSDIMTCSGIGARKFRTKIHDCGDRSVWTDTPSDRLKKREVSKGGSEERKGVVEGVCEV